MTKAGRLAGAIAGASLSAPLVYFLMTTTANWYYWQPAAATGRSYTSDSFWVFLVSALFILPISFLAVVAIVVPLTRYYARRGYATATFTSAMCALAGVFVVFAYQVYQVAFGSRVDALETAAVSTVALTIGACSAAICAVYWWLLDPLSYYGGR